MPSSAQTPPAADDAAPGGHASVPGALKRTLKNFRAHEMTDHAAALTYFTMMSLFPSLLVAVSLLGLVGTEQLVTDAVRYAEDSGAPEEVLTGLEGVLGNAVDAGTAVGFALVAGLGASLYGASGAFGAAGRALNVVYAVEDDRGFVRQKARNVGFTLVLIVLAIVALVSIFLGGGLAEDLFGTVGLGSTAATIWIYARWVVALAAAVLIYAIVYAFAPDLSARRFRWLSPGAVLGVLIWILASAGFFFYVANFGDYATYGVFAGAVILLLWLWLTNVCLLLGAELNAELERAETAGRAGPPPPTPPPSPGRPTAVPTAPGPARGAGRSGA